MATSFAPEPAVRQLAETVRPEAALAARGLQLHEPAPAFELLQARQALPPVQSRGAPPVQAPALHICPTVTFLGTVLRPLSR